VTSSVNKESHEECILVFRQDTLTENRLTFLLKDPGRTVVMLDRYSPSHQYIRKGIRTCMIREAVLDEAEDTHLAVIFNELPPIPFLVYTRCGDVEIAAREMKRGAIDVVAKPDEECNVLEAVNIALLIDADNLRLFDEKRILISRLRTLTPRELQVLTLIASGYANCRVAEELGISEVTVKVYRRAVMTKMAASSLAHLVVMYAELRELATFAQKAP
jgi:FixJ family two-component response regulator